MYLEPINFVEMKENQIQIHYNTYQWDELSESYKNLMDRSIAAQQNAYAPYSNFKVGAAILLENGTIFTGNILKQPVMKNRYHKKHPKCDQVANDVMKNGILLGCHQGMKKPDLDYICNTFKKFIKK